MDSVNFRTVKKCAKGYISFKKQRERGHFMTKYKRIDVYVPENHADSVKDAMFAAGAGTIGNYDRCCFQTSGRGQFRPLNGADPFLGAVGREEHVTEWKLEMICRADCIEAVIAALRKAHPYETPAFQYWDVEIRE